MRRRRPLTALRIFILLLTIAAFGALLLQLVGILPNRSSVYISNSIPTLTITQSIPTRPNSPAATASVLATEEDAIAETPADLWASAVLNYALPLLSESSASVEALAWWDTTVDSGVLSWEGGDVTINKQVIEVLPDQSVEVAIIDPVSPHKLSSIGAARILDTALQLSLTLPKAHETNQWLLSGASPNLALEALATQASVRGASLTVAYKRVGSSMQLVLLRAEINIIKSSQADTPTSSPVTSPMMVATSTRAPETYLGQVVADRIDPGIDAVQLISPALTQHYIARHPWAGILATSEVGATINNRPTVIAQAVEFSVYVLNDSSGSVTRLFSIEYTEDGTTRFPDDQLLFQAHRMEEILHWIVVRAAERRGQMIVAYDDFGTKQALTLIGFRMFSPSTP